MCQPTNRSSKPRQSTLGPRICRPVYIENTAWLCAQPAGCISSTVKILPPNPAYPSELYLPAILKSHP
jgi:hypothetical protein